MNDINKLYKKEEWTLDEFEKITGIGKEKLRNLAGEKGGVKHPLLSFEKVTNEKSGRKVKGIKSKQLFKIATYLFVMNVGADSNKKSIDTFTKEFNGFFNENRLMVIDILLDKSAIKQDLLKKIKRAEENHNTKYMLKLIEFMEKSKSMEQEEIPLSDKSKRIKNKFKDKFIFYIKMTLKLYQNEIEENEVNSLKNIKARISDIFDIIDLEEVIYKLKQTSIPAPIDVGSCFPIKKDNIELFEFLDSKEGLALNDFTIAFYEFIDILGKYSNLTSKYNDNLDKVYGIPEIYRKSINTKNDFKVLLGTPYLGYSDHHDGYYLPHKILHLKYSLEDYDSALNDLKKVLEKNIIDINIRDKNKDTIVKIAVNNQDTEVLKLLRRFGADPFKEYAFSIAIKKKNPKIIKEMIELVPDAHYSSILKDIYEGDLKTVQFLINSKWEKIKDIIIKDNGAYSLGLAILANNKDLLQLLRDKVDTPEYDRTLINTCLSLDKEELTLPFLKYINPLDCSNGNDNGKYPDCTYLSLAAQNNALKMSEKLFEQVDPTDYRLDIVLYEFSIFTNNDRLWDLFLNSVEKIKLTKKINLESPLDVLINKFYYKRIKQLIPKTDESEYEEIKEILSIKLKQFESSKQELQKNIFQNKRCKDKSKMKLLNRYCKDIKETLELLN